MQRGGGSGVGGMPGAPQNLLDAGALEYYPAVGAAYAFPPLPHQLFCPPPPPPYPVMPPPAPMPMVMPPPPPPPEPVAIPQQFGIPVPSAVDGPPSRAVVLSLLPPHAPEAEVARAMAPFGDVRAVDALGLASDGAATVHFFDLRAAERAVTAVREQHMRQQCRLSQHFAAAAAGQPPPAWDWQQDDGRGLVLGQVAWAGFVAASALPDDGATRGTLVVLNSLPDVSLSELRQAFQAYGDLKDVRESWSSSTRPTTNKFLEFFDTRDAARALAGLNGRDFFGHRLHLEYTRPSVPGARRRGYVPPRPVASTPPRLQTAWRPLPAPAQSPPPPSSSGTGKAREGFVLLRRSSGKSSSGDRSKGGSNNNNAGTSHERKGKGGKNITIVVSATSSSRPASVFESSASGKQQCGAKAVRRSRGWRGGWETRYEFKQPEAAAEADAATAAADTGTQEPDTRTTVMIRNIPNKYSQKLLLNMLDNHCIEYNKKIEAGEGEGEFEGQPFSSYDFLYLPIDFNNKCNVGYGFVNLTSPEAALRLYKAFHKQPWEVYNSRKICQVTYARVQGLEALKDHFKSSKFPCDSDEYLPVVFSPPRDGRQLTEPELLVPRTPVPSASSPSSATTAAINVDPLALSLMAPPSSSGDGASSTMSTRADGSNEDDDDDDDDDGLGKELQRLGYTD